MNQQVAIDNVITNDNNVTNIDNIGDVMNRHMQQIDSETGEVVDGFVAYVVPKRKNGFQRGWMAMAQDAMMMLAQKQPDRERHESHVGYAGKARLRKLDTGKPS